MVGMSMLKNNKKAMALVYLVMYGMIIALCTFYFFHTYKNAPQNTEFVGQVFLDSYKKQKTLLKICITSKNQQNILFMNQLVI